MSLNLTEQTKNAFEFVEKLYFEISYLIKEIEGMLQQEEERFIIIRPSGYGVTVRSSTGLESSNVAQWLSKSFTVFFCSEDFSSFNKGQTETKFDDNLMLIVIHLDIVSKDIDQPRIILGTIKNIKSKKDQKKFENLTWEFAYNDEKIFSSNTGTHYEDSYCSFDRDFLSENLYSINDNNDIVEKIIKPLLQTYRRN